MKKCMLIALVAVFTLVSVGSLCFADIRRGVTNTSKKGSLLVFPLIKVEPGTQPGPYTKDTIITLSNDYPGKVRMNCRYSDATCTCGGIFSFYLTSGQPISWLASTGQGIDEELIPSRPRTAAFDVKDLPDGFLGELRCWAVNGSNNPISWNHLSGTATILEGPDQSWEYSAWRFAVGYKIARNQVVSTDNIMRLTGSPIAYDACPEKLLFNFVEQVSDPDGTTYPENTADNQVTLVPCKQDCVTTTPIQAIIERRNEVEVDEHGYSCLNCGDNTTAFFSKSLSDAGKFNNPGSSAYDLFEDLGTPGGMFIVGNTPDSKYLGTCPATHGVPMLGVISNRWGGVYGPVSGETPTTVGRGQPTYTLPDGSDSHIEVQMTR